MHQKTEHWFIAFILLISFGLNLYGINWGLPARWNIDQSVTPALNMFKNKSFFPQEYYHPSLYYYVLALFIAPYLLYQYICYPDFSSFLSTASVSWNYMALTHPDLATGIFIWARLSSVIFSVLTVYLVYKIGKTNYNNIAGLFSALTLALTMDFVNWAHMEKYDSLVHLLTLVSIYYVLLVFKREGIRKNYILSCLFGGLAFSVKFNGGITFLLIPIISLWQFKKDIQIFSHRRFWGIFKTVLYGTAVYFIVFLLTSPNVLFVANKYSQETTALYKGLFIPANFTEMFKIWLPNLIGLLGTLVQMFGIPLALIVGIGVAYVLLRYVRRLPVVRIMLLFAGIILSLFALAPRIYKSPDSKFIALIVPFLAVLGGIFIADFASGKLLPKLNKHSKAILLFTIFIFSFFYCLSLDKIFAYDDLRYHATQWVKSNIPKKSNIIVNNPLEYSLGIEILKDYNVYVLGRKLGTKDAYAFLQGKYSGIDEDKFQEIKFLDSFYVIRSCWRLRGNHTYTSLSSSLDKFPLNLKLVKSFERKRFWFWFPDMGGYEPSRIEIYIKNNK